MSIPTDSVKFNAEFPIEPAAAGVQKPGAPQMPLPQPHSPVSANEGSFQAARVTASSAEEVLLRETCHVGELLSVVSTLNTEDMATVQATIDKQGEAIFNRIMDKWQPSAKMEGSLIKEDEPLDLGFLEALEAVATQVAITVESRELTGTLEGRALLTAIAPVELTVIFVNALGQFGILITMHTLIQKAEELLGVKRDLLKIAPKDECGQLQKEVEKLESWIKVHSTLLKKHALICGLDTAIALPKGITSIFHLIPHHAIVDSAALASGTLGWMVMGSSIIVAALRWRHAHANLKDHELWAATFAGNGVTAQDLGKIIAKQKETGEANSPKNVERNELVLSLHNALKTFAMQKKKIDHGFLKMHLNKAKGIFTASTLLAALTITFKILAVVGVASLTVALIATGYGLLAAIIGLTIVGLAYFYVKKPNLFKAYLHGVNTKLLMKKIPLAIQNCRRQFVLFELAKTLESIKLMHGRLKKLHDVDVLLGREGTLEYQHLPESLKNLLNKKNQSGDLAGAKKLLGAYRVDLIAQLQKKDEQLASLSHKAEALKVSIEKYEAKVYELQLTLAEAGWKDFQHHLHGKVKTSKDDSDVLAEFLLKDPAALEDHHIQGLLGYLNIDLERLRQIEDPGDAQRHVAEAVRLFFSMEEGDTIKLIRKQKLLAENG